MRAHWPMSWTPPFDNPEALALRALGFVASHRNEKARFLSRMGLSPSDLARPLAKPRHLAAVLDFLLEDEAALQEFSRAVDLPLEAAYEARRLVRRNAAAAPEAAAEFAARKAP